MHHRLRSRVESKPCAARFQTWRGSPRKSKVLDDSLHNLTILMYRFIATLTAIALLTAGCSAARTPANADMSQRPDSHASDHMSHGGEHDSHGMVAIPEGQPVPTVVLDVVPDPVSGWNVQVQTENWAFAPEQINSTSLTTEGHAHLYLDGKKLTRIYSEWFYISSLPSGEHTLTIGLNTNRHEVLMHNGEPIETSVQVTVPKI